MNVKHTPTEIVHKGQKGGNTGCGTSNRQYLGVHSRPLEQILPIK